MLAGKTGKDIVLFIEGHEPLSNLSKKHILNRELSIQMTKEVVETFSLKEWLLKTSNIASFDKSIKNTPLLESYTTKKGVIDALEGVIFTEAEDRLEKELEIGPDPESKTIALVPGAFKPPHRGHLDMVKHYSKLADEVVVLVSPLSRGRGDGEVTTDDSKKVWDIYLNAEGFDNVRVEISEYNSPVRAAIEYGNKPEVAGSSIILGRSKKLGAKGEEDSSIFSPEMQQYAPNIKMLDPKEYAFEPKEDPLSASDFRAAIEEGADISRWIPLNSRPFIDDILQVLAPESKEEEETTLNEGNNVFSLIEEEFNKLYTEDVTPRMSMHDGGGTEEWTNDKKKKKASSFLSDKKYNERPGGEEKEAKPASADDSVDQEITVTKDREIKIKNKVNEISTSGGGGAGQTGNVEGCAGGNKKNEESLIREEEDEMIEEVLNYLLSSSGE